MKKVDIILSKLTSDSYMFQFHSMIVKYVIKSDEFVRDEVYLNPIANFK